MLYLLEDSFDGALLKRTEDLLWPSFSSWSKSSIQTSNPKRFKKSRSWWLLTGFLFIKGKQLEINSLFLHSLNFLERYIFHPIWSDTDLSYLDPYSITVYQQIPRSILVIPPESADCIVYDPKLRTVSFDLKKSHKNLTLHTKRSANLGLSLAKIPAVPCPWRVSDLSCPSIIEIFSFLGHPFLLNVSNEK